MQRIEGGKQRGEDAADADGGKQFARGRARPDCGQKGHLRGGIPPFGDGGEHDARARADERRREDTACRPRGAGAFFRFIRRARVADDGRGEKGVHADVGKAEDEPAEGGAALPRIRRGRKGTESGQKGKDGGHERRVDGIDRLHPPARKGEEERRPRQPRKGKGRANAEPLFRGRVQPREHTAAHDERGGEQKGADRPRRPAEEGGERAAETAVFRAAAVKQQEGEGVQQPGYADEGEEAALREKADKLGAREEARPDHRSDERKTQARRARRRA